MNKFEKRYGIKESEETKKFHQSRRMFAIKGGIFYLGPINSSFSHAEWFEKNKWISINDSSEMDLITRGYINKSGLYFYRGWNFKFDSSDISILLEKLNEIIKILNLSKDMHLYGGFKKDSNHKMIPIKDFGLLRDLIN